LNVIPVFLGFVSPSYFWTINSSPFLRISKHCLPVVFAGELWVFARFSPSVASG
jgi:hypothetical protein